MRTTPGTRLMLLAIAIAVAIVPAAQAAPPLASAFGALPAEYGASLSPDGRFIAWIEHKEARPSVVLFDAQSRQVRRKLAVPPDAYLHGVTWNDNETVLISLGDIRSSVMGRNSILSTMHANEIIAHDVSGGDGRVLPMYHDAGRKHPIHGGVGILKAVHLSKPHTVVMETIGRCRQVTANCLQEVDTITGEPTPIKVASTATVDWVVDRDARPLARADWDPRKHAYRVYALHADDSIQEIFRTDQGERPVLVGALADGSGLVLLAALGQPHVGAWKLSLDGGPPVPLAVDAEADVVSARVDPSTRAVVGAEFGGPERKITWFDPASQRRYDSLRKAFGNRRVSVRGVSDDGTRVLARVDAADAVPVYYLVDFARHSADIAAEEYPALAGFPRGAARAISYPARDGTPIPAVLTMPPGHEAGPVPMVVLPHDGIESHDEPGFDWMVQFLATRGYAVLQPQYRGSSGYGEAFRTAGQREWGGKIQDDVSDGVRAMVGQGIADPKKVCIVGFGFGGFIAMSGAAFTPDLYACAAGINAVTDFPALLRAYFPVGQNASESPDMTFWRNHVGTADDPQVRARSPIGAVAAVRAPVLLAYSTGDHTTPSDQSTEFAQALVKQGKSATTVKLEGGDHAVTLGASRTQLLQELERFLAGAL